MRSLTLALSTLAVSVLFACSGDKPGGGSHGKAAEAAGPTQLAKLGLKVDVPGDPEVGDGILGDGVLVQGPGIAFSVEPAKEPKTLAQVKEEASMFDPKNPREETLADGFVYTFENTGSAGTNYWVKVFRTIDGKTYECSTTANEASQSAAAVAACKTLRK